MLKTFPHIEDQLRWVDNGTDAYVTAGVEIYGDPNRPGGAHVTKAKGVMPGQAGQLTDAQILAVVCHERFTLGGADPIGANEDEFDNWCADDSPAWTAWKTARPPSTTSTPRSRVRSRSARNLRRVRPPAAE